MPKQKTSSRRSWSSPNPTAPAIESRVPIFAPILRVSHNSHSRTGRYETPWGWVELGGPILTMKHWAILKMAVKMAVEKQVFKETGEMAVLFDAWEVKKALGEEYLNGGKGHKQFIQKIREIYRAELRVHNNRTGRTRESRIIDSHTYDENHPDNPKRQGVKTTWRGHCLYEIRLSPTYMQFFREDLRVHYDPLVPEIVAIPDGTIQAIILFFLSHKEKCHYPIRKVMEIIGAIEEGMTKGTVSKIMTKPSKFKVDLEGFGIFIEGEMIRYERHPKVFFTNPPAPIQFPTSTGAVIDTERGQEPTSPETALEDTPEAMIEPNPPEK